MDAPEEDYDIKLQKISGDLISEFDKSLPSFLRKPNANANGAGATVVRSRVKTREMDSLISGLLDPFQELPQLLDPHLPGWLPQLGGAFLEHHALQQRHPGARRFASSSPASADKTLSKLLTPLPTAVCKLLYTLCKIRGEKVIVRFLSNETRHLELLLSALEEAERRDRADVSPSWTWTWEERYVVLLWLSHLMFAPFDLATISSTHLHDEGDGEGDGLPVIPGFVWPREGKLPGVAIRILPLAMKYLSSPGKERDAAKALLVRISLRRDMQELGVLDALVRWALVALRPGTDGGEQKTPYHYIGVLSFLAGILGSSADTSDMDRYLVMVFRAVHGASAEAGQSGTPSVASSALARKAVIKVIRAVAVLVLRNQNPDDADSGLVETTIGFLLDSLGDNETPVRLAASKALSVITLKLDPEMASQVIDAVHESLHKNILWKKDPSNPSAPRTRDLSAVDPLEWHGLMLTLSHLVYRRSPPAENLSAIIQALIIGLSFERRSPSGGSVGANVRDAACFGIWALARRYTTKELLAVRTPAARLPKHNAADASVLQVLATELIVAATLDPSGNIRRGSSAALQELIGRHPDTVEKGIWVVQTVDYHAVALRSRAFQEVALGATKLSAQYGEAILSALLGWRGVGDIDAASRRAAGASYGAITADLAAGAPDPVERLTRSVREVLNRIQALQTRQVEELHGLLLSFGAVLDSLPATIGNRDKSSLNDFIRISLAGLEDIMAGCTSKSYRKPELTAEAASCLVISAFPLLQAAALAASPDQRDDSADTLLAGRALLDKSGEGISRLATALDTSPPALAKLGGLIKSCLHMCLLRPEEEVITPASEAGLVLLIFSPKAEREGVIREWADAVRQRPSGRFRTAGGFFAALVLSYTVVATLDLPQEDSALICDALLERWASDKDTDTRVLILRSLTGSELLARNLPALIGLVADGLDDYTTNARGDVGSLVRFRAVKATKALWETFVADTTTTASTTTTAGEELQLVSSLFLRVLRLAAEKLDRVRAEAQAALAAALVPSYAATLRTSTFSSRPYFGFLLSLLGDRGQRLHPAMDRAVSSTSSASTSQEAQLLEERWMEELMAGIVSSADTGNEDLVIAARAALCDICTSTLASAAAAATATNAVCSALVRNLRSHQGNDRVVVPTLEVIAFLFHVGIFARCTTVDLRALCLQVQKAGYKTGNVRKIEACIRVYGALAGLCLRGPEHDGDDTEIEAGGLRQKQNRPAAAAEARKRLGALLFHPWPRVRSTVVDELWGLVHGENRDADLGLGPAPEKGSLDSSKAKKLLGVDWGVAGKAQVKCLVQELGLA